MKIDLKQKINTLSGAPYKVGDEDLTLGGVIAEVLASDASGGKMKLYALAQKAFKQDELEVDTADLALIKAAFEQTKAYNNNAVIIGQAQEFIENAR